MPKMALAALAALMGVYACGGKQRESPASTWVRSSGLNVNLTSVAATPDGDAIVVGSSMVSDAGERGSYLARVSASGEVAWSKHFRGEVWDSPGARVAVSQGGVIFVTGYTVRTGPAIAFGEAFACDGC